MSDGYQFLCENVSSLAMQGYGGRNIREHNTSIRYTHDKDKGI